MKSLIRILAFAIFFSPYLSWSQTSEDKRLAMQFYQMHDYEKAELLLKKQYDLAPSEFFEPLFKTYIQVRKYNDAILIAKQQLKGKESKNIDLRFKLGYAYYKNNDSVNSKKEWQIANELAVENEYEVNNLIMQYRDLKQWKMAEEIILLYQKKI